MIEILGAAARWFQLTANLIILGSCVFLALAGINKRVNAALWVEKLERLFPRLAIGILIGLIVTIAATIAQITGETNKLLEVETVSHFITGTRTGTMWAAQFALAVMLWISTVMLIRMSPVRSPWRYILTAIIAMFPLIADALVSHAAAEGMAMANILPYALHIILAGVWLGGLPALLLLKYEYVKQEKSKRANVFDSHILKRFSTVALPVMLLIMATGILVSDRIFDGNYATLVATPYGWLLLAKLALLGIILIIASSVRAYWLPRFTNSKSSEETRSSATGMRKWVRIEFLWAVVLVLIATILANNATPAKYAQIEEWPYSFRFSIAATWNTENVPILVWSGLILIATAFGVLFYGRSVAWNLKRLIIIPSAVLVLGLAVALPPLTIEAYPETYRKPPVPFDVISIAYGAQNYTEHCVECHGHQGKGDGIKARTLSTVLPDMLTEPHTVEHTPGDFYHWITYGMKNTDMPGYKDELTEEDRWDLVNYVFALSRGYQARILSPEVIPNRAHVQPPVFSYNAHDGSSGALQDFRGNKPVLLVIFSWPYSQARIAQLKAAYTTLAAQNIQVLVVPAHELEADVLAEITQDMPYPVVADTAREITQSYALSRRTMSHPDLLGRGSIPDHMEYLIDRSGYLRARWIPSADETGWENMGLLIKQIEQLNTEKLPVVQAKDTL